MHKVLTDDRCYRWSKIKQERKANRTEDQLPRCEGMKRLHGVGGKYLNGRNGPLKRWLRSRSGYHWDKVFSEAAQVFKLDDFVRRQMRIKLLDMVERNTFMRDGEVWCCKPNSWRREQEVPVQELRSRRDVFYVHPESGVLLPVPDKPRGPRMLESEEKKFGGVKRKLPKDFLLLKLKGHWFECRMVRYPKRWEVAPYDVLVRLPLIASHARELYGESFYCIRKRQLSRKELRERGLSNSRSAADCFLTVIGERLLGKIQRANGNPVRCWLQCRTDFCAKASIVLSEVNIHIKAGNTCETKTMRADMHKVICESPRGGQYWARRFPRPQINCEEAPKYESITKPHKHRKWFGEHLGPLKRWLRSNVGRPWNDVYSEGSPIFKPDNVVRAHIRFHLLQMVRRNTFMRDGEIWDRGDWMEHKLRGGITCSPVFYVHPESGLLLESHATWKQERKAQQQAEKLHADHRWLTDDTMLKQIEGVWYEFRFKKLHDGNGVFDLLERRVVFSHDVGRAGACYSKHQLSHRELKRFGLVNQATVKARSSRHQGALTTALHAFSSRWPSSSGNSLQNCLDGCDSHTGFQACDGMR